MFLFVSFSIFKVDEARSRVVEHVAVFRNIWFDNILRSNYQVESDGHGI